MPTASPLWFTEPPLLPLFLARSSKTGTPPVVLTPILRIVLTGFMGAGKTTLGALLAAQLGWCFVDSDEELVRARGASVAGLFEQLGEAGFRTLEEEAIAGLLVMERTVIALGGGALESAATRDRLLGAPHTHIVFLETPLDVALRRCEQQSGAAVRPVLRDQAVLADRFHRRLEHYRRAHQTVLTADRLPEELVLELLQEVSRLQGNGPSGPSLRPEP